MSFFTLETDKVSTEVNAPESGVVETSAAEGDEVKIDQVVATIERPALAPVQPKPWRAEPARQEGSVQGKLRRAKAEALRSRRRT